MDSVGERLGGAYLAEHVLGGGFLCSGGTLGQAIRMGLQGLFPVGPSDLDST